MPHTSTETAASDACTGTEKGRLISTPRRPSAPFTSSVASATPSTCIPLLPRMRLASAREKTTASSVSEKLTGEESAARPETRSENAVVSPAPSLRLSA